ncbi:MAG: hypothetical protein GY801_29175 [bacterium]|nr:hypothetical protein [bacterium]
MKGDFSRWSFGPKNNFNGVLHQQGKVLLDSDWNAQTNITTNWQDQAGTDVIGPGVAAIPADKANGFKVTKAEVDIDKIKINVIPGRAWADGLLVYLDGDTEVSRIAAYLQSPIQDPPADESTIGENIRDAVILEVWREAINGFQIPEQLIEPALGGPDTTERAHTAMAFRLLRLEDKDTCRNIGNKLKDDFSQKGTLKVSLQPTTIIPGECPVVEGGGYTGFEHHLYRIEIARVNSRDDVKFKVSRFNGGLVGRGDFEITGPSKKISITANLPAISTSGMTEFYLEVVEREENEDYWKVTYGAQVSLNGADLEVVSEHFNALGTPSDNVFFRLWDGIHLVADFPKASGGTEAVELRDGIHLEFDNLATKDYVPGDYWNFQVRAGEIGNSEVLIDSKPPKGIHYHRVPLAILNWNESQNISAGGNIQDCRHTFQPLTRLGTCCTYRVGDGTHSYGDFDSIQEALNRLPATGGQICILPGIYTENVLIDKKSNITISGCGERSKIISQAPDGEFGIAAPVIHVKDSQNIHIESLAVAADNTGVGILLEGSPPKRIVFGNTSIEGPTWLREITLANLHISAATRSAIEAHGGQFITISTCCIEMSDIPGTWPGIFFVGEDAWIKNNVIRVQPGRQGDDVSANNAIASAGLGGLQLGGTSERVRVMNNLIQGGLGNGITLGSIQSIDKAGNEIGGFVGWVINADDPCRPCKPGDIFIPPREGEDEDGIRQVSAGSLDEIYIECNRILDMGLNGVGVIGFFDLDATDEFISVKRLSIIGNEIRRCLQRPIAPIPTEMIDDMGYGGIALADVEYLVIQDNIIEDNGLDHLDPICGVFILHGVGIDISNNRIFNNGAKTNKPDRPVKDGRRGGINIVYGVTPTEQVIISRQEFPRQNGVPAVRVHGNIVSVPLGRALSLTALGPVSVIGNQFTSRGMVLKPTSPTFTASTVAIMNLGISNEFYGQLLAFSTLREGQVEFVTRAAVTENAVIIPQEGLDDRRIGQYLANGNVLFSDNQCVLDLLETGLSLSVSSMFIFSLDDIGFHNNQCDCSLLDDFVISQAILFGLSMRMNANRFKEGVGNALYSAVTLGMLNMTTHNQATHCLLIRGFQSMVVNHPNTVFLEGLTEAFSCASGKVLDNFGLRRGVVNNG